MRVSGNSKITEIPQIADAIKQPDSYVRDFSYLAAPKNTDKPLLLAVNFTPQAIKDLLNKANQPIWSQDRPATLVWLVKYDTKGPHLFSNDDEPIVNILKENENQFVVLLNSQERPRIKISHHS